MSTASLNVRPTPATGRSDDPPDARRTRTAPPAGTSPVAVADSVTGSPRATTRSPLVTVTSVRCGNGTPGTSRARSASATLVRPPQRNATAAAITIASPAHDTRTSVRVGTTAAKSTSAAVASVCRTRARTMAADSPAATPAGWRNWTDEINRLANAGTARSTHTAACSTSGRRTTGKSPRHTSTASSPTPSTANNTARAAYGRSNHRSSSMPPARHRTARPTVATTATVSATDACRRRTALSLGMSGLVMTAVLRSASRSFSGRSSHEQVMPARHSPQRRTRGTGRASPAGRTRR